MLSAPWMLSKYHNQAQYQLNLKINTEQGGRRVRNLLPYEQACWQPAPAPCTLNALAQYKVNLVHIWETCYYHLLHESLQTETMAQTHPLFSIPNPTCL